MPSDPVCSASWEIDISLSAKIPRFLQAIQAIFDFFRSRFKLFCVYSEALGVFGPIKGSSRGIEAERRQS